MLRFHLRSSHLATLALVLLTAGGLTVACSGSSPPGPGDAGNDEDAGVPGDAGVSPVDAGGSDATVPRDAASSPDAPPPLDAPSDTAVSPSPDAALDAPVDAVVGLPADAALDAPSDSSSPRDAGVDAADAGFVIETDAGTFTASTWMGAFPGSTSVADLSIPGTHDTGATIDMPGTTGTTKCQNLSIADQLATGVRYLDIRVQNLANKLEVYHLTVDQQLTFDSVLQTITTFFAANPSETLVMSVKEETPDPQTGSTNTFAQTFDAYTAQNAGLWYLGDSIPTLAQARGKIVLLRRFGATTSPEGIDATSWADNTSFTIANGNATLQIQDYYQVTDDPSKWTAIKDLFAFALQPDAGAGALFLNNTSAYLQLDSGLEDILFVSNVINPELTTYFTGAAPGRYGIVGMDFVDSAKASLILRTNFK
jgi:1-phosphatidylinositol phosphodiesterase